MGVLYGRSKLKRPDALSPSHRAFSNGLRISPATKHSLRKIGVEMTTLDIQSNKQGVCHKKHYVGVSGK